MAVTREQVAELFVATFNRAPLSEGLDYWTSSDFSIEMVANSFFDQAEAQAAYTNDGEAISSQQFVIRIFNNLFTRLPAVAGLEYWANALDSGSVSQGEMILAVMNGATGDDASILSNKTTAGLYYADQGGTSNDFSLKDIDETDDSLTNAMAAVDSAVATSTDFALTADTDRLTGTSGNDSFEAAITQNPWAGGVSNTLSTADRLDGGAGSDSLYAELVPEFFGVTGDNQMDIQADIKSIEDIMFEAMDVASSVNATLGTITVDAKDITDVVRIGSAYSDGDLRIENLTTLTASGSIRNTEDITIVMDHTDNFDSDGDASDLTVLFDEDYLVSGQTSQASAHYFLLDEDAELNGLAERLNRINVDGIRFTLGDPAGDIIELSDPTAQTSLTHEAFVAALQDDLQALIDAGTVPEGTTLTLDPTITDTTGLDDGSISNTIPAIVLTTGDGTIVTPVGYSQVEDVLGNYDVYGQFSAAAETANNPVTINVEFNEKVGRDGEGGDLIIGGKDLDLNGDSDVDQTDGIAVFNMTVNGNADQPSNLGTVRSTNQALDTAIISNGDDWTGAALTIRDVIGGGQELTLINATEFSGDFSLAMSIPGVSDLMTGNGTSQQALTSLFGSGDDSYDWMSVEADLVSSGKDYSISMGSGDDTVTATLDGDSVDALGESFDLNAGAGDDYITLDRNDGADDGVSQTTMRLLDNIDIDLSSGDDILDMDNNFNANIEAGDGDDFVYMNAADANGNGTGGAIAIGNNTGVQNFGERVLYNADVTISYAGFEATVDIDTIAANGFVADQAIINDAVMEAIDTDPVLSRLLTYSLDDGTQQLMITPAHTLDEAGNALAIDGANSIGIAIYQPTLVTANAGDGEVVLSSGDLASVEAGFIATNNLHNTTNTLVNTLDSDNFVDVATAVGAINGLNWEGSVNEFGVGDNTIYTEIETDVELARGAQTSDILDDSADNYLDYTTIGTDSTTGFNLSSINMGTGTNDIVVMHSNDNNAGVLEFDGTFGKVSVVNWHNNATNTITNANQMGFNATDFTALLDNQIDPSATTNTNSAVDVAVTTNIVAGTEAVTGLSAGVNNNNNTAVANGVNVIRFIEDAANSETFENLTASTLVASLNNGGTAYGNIQDNTLDAAIAANGIVIGGTAKHIIMVENSTNEGEYKVFYVESDDDATTNANGDFNAAGALELGTVDFGASVNLLQVGSTAHDSLIENLTAAIDAGAATFTYDADGSGTVSGNEGYTIIDESGIIDPNTPPVAADDDAAFTVVQDNSVVINVADLLANDTDADNDTLTITAVDDAGTTDGTAVLSGDTITFTAAAGYTGAATFTYTLSDGTTTDTASVNGTVTDGSTPVATPVAVTATDNGTTYTAVDTAVETFTIDNSASYTYNIQGFELGVDVIDMPDGTTINNTALDGVAGLQWASDGVIVEVNLVGLTDAQDTALVTTAAWGDSLI